MPSSTSLNKYISIWTVDEKKSYLLFVFWILDWFYLAQASLARYSKAGRLNRASLALRFSRQKISPDICYSGWRLNRSLPRVAVGYRRTISLLSLILIILHSLLLLWEPPQY